MCAIIEWNGKLPKGIISSLLKVSESRGKDSTGLAFRIVDELGPGNLCRKQAVPAHEFNKRQKELMSKARRAVIGIGHTRRASPGMPVDNDNAHPYDYPRGDAHSKMLFAHNGRIRNDAEVRERQANHFFEKLSAVLAVAANNDKDKMVELETAAHDAAEKLMEKTPAPDGVDAEAWKEIVDTAARLQYAEKATTDSMVLGPAIAARDFSDLTGDMTVVWMVKDEVFVMRHAKEAAAVNIVWRYLDGKAPDGGNYDEHVVTIVGSTREILEKVLESVRDIITFDHSFLPIKEDRIYKVLPTGLEDQGEVPVGQAVKDEWSSATVADPTPTATA